MSDDSSDKGHSVHVAGNSHSETVSVAWNVVRNALVLMLVLCVWRGTVCVGLGRTARLERPDGNVHQPVLFKVVLARKAAAAVWASNLVGVAVAVVGCSDTVVVGCEAVVGHWVHHRRHHRYRHVLPDEDRSRRRRRWRCGHSRRWPSSTGNGRLVPAVEAA